MSKAKKSRNATSSALLKWENLGKKLATTLSAYLESCVYLETLSASQDVYRSDMPSRIETSLKILHAKLFDELTESQLILSRMHNKMSSRFYALPNEILAEIFLDVVYNPSPDEPRFPKMADGIQRILGRLHGLMAVCSAWRNVVLELGELWTVVPVTDSKSARPLLEASSLALQRSQARTLGNHHLHLAVVLWDKGYNPATLFSGTEIPAFTTVNIEAQSKPALSSVSSLLHKLLGSQSPSVISELSIHQSHDPEKKPPFRTLERGEYLDFRMSKDEQKAFQAMFESLSALRLRNVNIRWDTISAPSQLIELHLQSLVLDGLMANKFLYVLRSTPELRSLKLISVVALSQESYYIKQNGKITLPKLQLLLLSDLFHNVLKYVLTSIDPGSHQTKVALTGKSWRTLYDMDALHWEIDGGYNSNRTRGWGEDDYGDEVEDNDIIDLLDDSDIDTLILSPDLCKLRWEGERFLHMMLGSFPTLESLIVIGWDWSIPQYGNALIHTLEQSLSDDTDSSLVELYILDSVIEGAELLPGIAVTHSLQTLVVDSPESLRSKYGDREEIIQRLRRIVPDFRFVGGSENMDELDYRSWRFW